MKRLLLTVHYETDAILASCQGVNYDRSPNTASPFHPNPSGGSRPQLCRESHWRSAPESAKGRWRNLDNKGEPSYIDVKMLGGCGDQVLNGEQTGSTLTTPCGSGSGSRLGNSTDDRPSRRHTVCGKANNGCRVTFQRAATLTRCGCMLRTTMGSPNCTYSLSINLWIANPALNRNTGF